LEKGVPFAENGRRWGGKMGGGGCAAEGLGGGWVTHVLVMLKKVSRLTPQGKKKKRGWRGGERRH